MGQLMGFLISIFMFASLFVSSADTLKNTQERRIIKQNMNLSGRSIINYINDEISYLKNLETMNNMGDIVGGIFCYKDEIIIAKRQKKEYQLKTIKTANMDENNKVNTINNMLMFVCEGNIKNNNDIKTEINMAVENEEDYLTNVFFNKLKDNTIFIICQNGKDVIISGFQLNLS